MKELCKSDIKKNIREFITETKQNGTHDVLGFCIGYYGQVSPLIYHTIMKMYRDGELKAGNGFNGKYFTEL